MERELAEEIIINLLCMSYPQASEEEVRSAFDAEWSFGLWDDELILSRAGIQQASAQLRKNGHRFDCVDESIDELLGHCEEAKIHILIGNHWDGIAFSIKTDVGYGFLSEAITGIKIRKVS